MKKVYILVIQNSFPITDTKMITFEYKKYLLQHILEFDNCKVNKIFQVYENGKINEMEIIFNGNIILKEKA